MLGVNGYVPLNLRQALNKIAHADPQTAGDCTSRTIFCQWFDKAANVPDSTETVGNELDQAVERPLQRLPTIHSETRGRLAISL